MDADADKYVTIVYDDINFTPKFKNPSSHSNFQNCYTMDGFLHVLNSEIRVRLTYTLSRLIDAFTT